MASSIPTNTKAILLRKMPPDVYKIVIEAQGKKKTDCSCQFSIEQTIYMLIRRIVKEELIVKTEK